MWTRTPPAKWGWYWYRNLENDAGPSPVWVSIVSDGIWVSTRQWQGPGNHLDGEWWSIPIEEPDNE